MHSCGIPSGHALCGIAPKNARLDPVVPYNMEKQLWMWLQSILFPAIMKDPKTYETRLYFTYTVRENSLTFWGYGQYLADKFHDVRSIAR